MRVVLIIGLVLIAALCWSVCAASDFDEDDEREHSGLLEDDK